MKISICEKVTMCVSDNLVYLELQSSEIPYFPRYTNPRDSTKNLLIYVRLSTDKTKKAQGGDF